MECHYETFALAGLVRKLGILAINLLLLPACHSCDPNKGEGMKGLGPGECQSSCQPISIKKSNGATGQE